MAKRKDGKETRQKLLDMACEVFAEKGFREAKLPISAGGPAPTWRR
jgi:AcrR family transcriptional regulator